METVLKNPHPTNKKLTEELIKANSLIKICLARKSIQATQKHTSPVSKIEEIVFAINTYRYAIDCRMKDIVLSLITLWNVEKYVGCFLLARALLETFAHFVHTAEKISECNDGVDKLLQVIQKSALGSKVIGDVPPYHINDSIRAFKRLVGKGQVDPKILQELYDDLSEIAHPNGLGVLGLYIDFKDDGEYVNTINKPKPDLQASLLRRLLQALQYYELFEYCDDLFDKSLPQT